MIMQLIIYLCTLRAGWGIGIWSAHSFVLSSYFSFIRHTFRTISAQLIDSKLDRYIEYIPSLKWSTFINAPATESHPFHVLFVFQFPAISKVTVADIFTSRFLVKAEVHSSLLTLPLWWTARCKRYTTTIFYSHKLPWFCLRRDMRSWWQKSGCMVYSCPSECFKLVYVRRSWDASWNSNTSSRGGREVHTTATTRIWLLVSGQWANITVTS